MRFPVSAIAVIPVSKFDPRSPRVRVTPEARSRSPDRAPPSRLRGRRTAHVTRQSSRAGSRILQFRDVYRSAIVGSMAASAGARASCVPMPDMRDGVCGLGSGETVTPRAWRNLKPGSWAPMARTASTGHCTLRDFEAAASRVPVRDCAPCPWAVSMDHAACARAASRFGVRGADARRRLRP